MSTFERYGINGPRPHLFYGNLPEIHKYGNVICVSKWMKKYGSIFGYYVGGKRVLIIAEPNILKQIQIKEFKQFTFRFSPVHDALFADKIFKFMIVSVGGFRWKMMRTILRQAFTTLRLKSAFNSFEEPIDVFLKKIYNHAKNDEEFDIYPLFQALTMEAIGRGAFGATSNPQTNPRDEFLNAAKAVFEASSKNFLHGLALMFPEFEFIIHPIRRLWNEILVAFDADPFTYLGKICSKIIEHRRNQYKPRNDLLQTMIETKVNLAGLKKMNEDSLDISSDTNASEQSVE
ncbi:Cytochrome P450 3A8-like protein, partial [Dinothrombium tinctorium]